MAATQNALLSRMRSARAPPANSSRSLTSSSSSTSHTQSLSTVSNISLFLTNLRLLDLDLLPDWPDINSQTFNSKDAAQGQKKRIQSVEWTLYQLFALWDPQDARDKLQPFFPPLDPLQSTNLRSALLRSLNQAKNDGVLGRDIVLRKTMLDECKGERLEEILAVFSSAVLKKLAAEEHSNPEASPAVALNIALEKRGYSGERNELVPLIFAHKASIRTKLDQKHAARTQYMAFAKVLDSKEREIADRQDQASAAFDQASSTTLSEDDKTQVRRAVRNNWTGNERWMEALLYGDAKSRQDGLLTAPFDRIWRRVRTGRLGDLEDKSNVGLLEQLDDRVRVQQERLGKWKTFKQEIFGDGAVIPGTESGGQIGRPKGIDFGFGVHESLRLGMSSPRKLEGMELPRHEEYANFIDGLETTLKQISQVPVARSFQRLRGRAQYVKSPTQSSSSEKPIEESLSELSELEEDLASAATLDRHPAELDLEREMHTNLASKQASKRPRPKLPQPLSTTYVYRARPQSAEVSPVEPTKPHTTSPRRSPVRHRAINSPSLVHSPTQALPVLPKQPPSPHSPILRTQSPEELPPSPTQQQADQILASMSAATPSPTKQSRPRHTLSLAERTRLSMVRGDNEDELAMGSPSSTRLRRRNTSSRSPTKHKADTPTIPEYSISVGPANPETAEEDDLVARTRRSMANFEASQQKARLEKQRSLKRAARQSSGSIARQSYFPSEEGVEEAASENATVVLEELIEREAEGVDYESVFKSRPKIKTSPPSTPARSGGLGYE